MTGRAFIKAYSQLSRSAEVECLSRLSLALTIAARETYIPQTEAIADPVRLRRFNELQHRIAGRLVMLTTDRTADRQGEAFAEYLLAGTKDLDCPHVLAQILPTQHRTVAKRRAVA